MEKLEPALWIIATLLFLIFLQGCTDMMNDDAEYYLRKIYYAVS